MTIPVYEWSKEEVQTIKAAWNGDHHSRLALTIIIERLAGIHASSFNPDPALMAFNEGRRFVARELMTAINLPVDKIVKELHEPHSSRPITATERASRVAAGEPGPIAAAAARTGRRGRAVVNPGGTGFG